MSPDWAPEAGSAACRSLGKASCVRLVNDVLRWRLSGILHGEQAALNLAAELCRSERDPAIQEHFANQAREEARHVAAFPRYIRLRWDEPYPPGPAFARYLRRLLATEEREER